MFSNAFLVSAEFEIKILTQPYTHFLIILLAKLVSLRFKEIPEPLEVLDTPSDNASAHYRHPLLLFIPVLHLPFMQRGLNVLQELGLFTLGSESLAHNLGDDGVTAERELLSLLLRLHLLFKTVVEILDLTFARG